MDAMDAMDASRLCLRNDSHSGALRDNHTLAAQQRQAHGRHDSGQHTRIALRIAAARGSERALSCDTRPAHATH